MGLPIGGKRKTLALDVYSDVRLNRAGEKHEYLRRLLAQGIDPIEDRKQARAQSLSKTTNSFETVAREWFLKNKHV